MADNPTSGRPSDLVRELRAALAQLSFAAQTSGGVAGRDEGLCAAIEPCEALLAKADTYIRELDAAQPVADEAVAVPEPFIVGNRYRTQAGELVHFVAVHNKGTHHETMEDAEGVNRYTSRDFGRVTGTAHDYSDPRNTPPLYLHPFPTIAAQASVSEQLDALIERIGEDEFEATARRFLAKCGCGLATCVEPWGPGCGLGLSKEHAVRVDDIAAQKGVDHG